MLPPKVFTFLSAIFVAFAKASRYLSMYSSSLAFILFSLKSTPVSFLKAREKEPSHSGLNTFWSGLAINSSAIVPTKSTHFTAV